MRFTGKVLFALLTLVFVFGAEAADEWVQIYRPDVSSPEWVKINTEKRSGQILRINGSSLTVDIGISRGVRKGGLFLVYSEKNRATQPLAVIRVVQTAGNFSICEMTPYIAGGEVRVGDLVTPTSILAERDVVYCDPSVVYKENVTEGFVSTPRVYGVPANVAAAVSAPVVAGIPAAVPAVGAYTSVPAPIPAPVPAQVAVPGPVPPAPVPASPYDAYGAYSYAPSAPQAAQVPQSYAIPQGAPAPQTYAVPQAAPVPQSYVAPQTYPASPMPYAQASPYPNNVTYPPYPNYQNTSAVQLDFDANRISDARLIRTFPISQPEMNALEIQFRGAFELYNNGDFYGAYQAFAGQFNFRGNYLSPYWAGLSALKMGNRQAAIDLLNQALSINPYYEPARAAIVAAQTYVPPQPQPAQPKIQKRVRRGK
jgi:hypothetical protein